MTLKLVGKEAPAKPPRRRGERLPLLSQDEAQRFRQALKNLRDAFGTWPFLAKAMDVRVNALGRTVSGRASVTGDMVVRAMRASGLSLAELLGKPVSADRCRACGQFKPRAA